MTPKPQGICERSELLSCLTNKQLGQLFVLECRMRKLLGPRYTPWPALGLEFRHRFWERAEHLMSFPQTRGGYTPRLIAECPGVQPFALD